MENENTTTFNFDGTLTIDHATRAYLHMKIRGENCTWDATAWTENTGHPYSSQVIGVWHKKE